MIFRIVTKQGTVIDINPSGELNFLSECATARLNGAWQNGNVCIPYDNIAFFCYGDMQGMPVVAPNAPTVETKQ